MLDPWVLLLLAGVGCVAGFVDAIAGGGGLLAIPALLAVGVPPLTAFGTNKVQGVIGTAIAASTYWRRGFVDLQLVGLALPLAFAGSFLGAFAVEHVDTSFLARGVPVALMLVALYFLFAPRLTDESRGARLDPRLFVPVLGVVVGFYDGLLGPGTGSFMTMGFVALFGLGVTRAAGNTKALNLCSNLGALALFIPSGDVAWAAAASMAVGQVAGGYLGARTGIRFGARLIRPLVVIVSVILALRALLVH